METIKFFKAYQVLVFIMLLIAYVDSYAFKTGGLFTGLFEIAAELLGLFLIFKNRANFSNKTVFVSILNFFLCMLIADLNYIVLFYALDISNKSAGAVFSTAFFYFLSFSFGALAMIRSTKTSLIQKRYGHFLFSLSHVLSVLLGTFVFERYFTSALASGFKVYAYINILVVVSSLLCLPSAVILFFKSRNPFWSAFSGALLVLILSDWSLRLETLTGHSPQFGFYEYFWAFGVFACVIPFIVTNDYSEKIAFGERVNLLFLSKLFSITSLILVVIIFVLLQPASFIIIRISSLGLGLSIILSNLLGSFMIEKIQIFDNELNSLLSTNENKLVWNASILEKVPLELLDSYKLIYDKTVQLNEEKKARELEDAVINQKAILAAQVSHDIRSPLSALEMMLSGLDEVSESKRSIIRNSIYRIRDIANSLLNSHKTNRKIDHNAENVLIAPVVDSLITEKRIQYRQNLQVNIHFEQDEDSYGLFTAVNITEFKRVLSNLIDNSVESFKNSAGEIHVKLKKPNTEKLVLSISDNGSGISAHLLPNIGTRGFSSKSSGSGLGLSHAKEKTAEWQGALEIQSDEERGTEVRLNLPSLKPSGWFVSEISVSPNSTIVTLDDDQSIHGVWRERLGSKDLNISLIQFASPQDFRCYYRDHFANLDHALFLMDYELGMNENGLDLIESLGIQQQSILITSRYDEPEIRERCQRLNVKIIPKVMSRFVPIRTKR